MDSTIYSEKTEELREGEGEAVWQTSPVGSQSKLPCSIAPILPLFHRLSLHHSSPKASRQEAPLPLPVSAKHHDLQKCFRYTRKARMDAWPLGKPYSSLLTSEPAPCATTCLQGLGLREIYIPEQHWYLCPWCSMADHPSRAAAADQELPPSCPLPNPPNLPREPYPTPLSKLPGDS